MRDFVGVLILLSAGCVQEAVIVPAGPGLGIGTWGGDETGVIVQDSVAHVHIGCTNGYFSRPSTLASSGSFTATGSYVLRAYPVQTGPSLPAQMNGVVVGNRLTFSVVVNDTVEKKVVTLGPSVVTFGREPSMANCPICRSPL